MKTMMELATELGVPKIKVYRYIKKRFIETHQQNGVIYLDEMAEMQVKRALQGEKPLQSETVETHQTVSFDTELIRILKQTIELQNQTIESQRQTIENQTQQINSLIELNKNQQILLKQEQDRHQPGTFWRRFLPAPKNISNRNEKGE